MIAYCARRLIDGISAQPRIGVALLVEGDRIVDVCPRERVPADAQIVDFGDRTIVPGLIDCHVHIHWNGSPDPQAVTARESRDLAAMRCAAHARQTLRCGVTAIRDVGTPWNLSISLRDAIEAGVVLGPRVFAAGSPIAMTGGHVHYMAREADGVDEVRRAVREQMKAQADLTKVMASGGVYTRGEEPNQPQFTVAELRAAVEETHWRGRKVAAHAEGPIGIDNALEAGVDTIEHGNLLTDEQAARMAAQGTFLVPTLAPFYIMATQGARLGVPDYAVRKAQALVDGHRRAIALALKHGVRIAAGTDVGSPCLPHSMLVDELDLMVRYGLTPMQAIQSATSIAAAACGAEDRIGALTAGRLADFLVLDADPLADILNLKQIHAVYKGGVRCFAGEDLHDTSRLFAEEPMAMER